ncbi:MAG: energy-coupling factor transporter transmembrane component T [Corynebacterium sp.]|nr:energy-coupling factor transporter transmembrane component T [Corynebacterium sp.]
MPKQKLQLNELTVLMSLFLITVPLLSKISLEGSALSLAITVAVGCIMRVKWSVVLKRLMGLALLIPISSLSMLLYAKPEGHIYWSMSVATISSNSIHLAIAVALRILALTMPIAVLVPYLDTVRLGYACTQILKIPRRFVVGTIGGLRMLPLIRHDWEQLSRARRARGLGNQFWLTAFFSQSFSLLVLSLRRAQKLARAMEVRGLSNDPARKTTSARTSVMTSWDYQFLVLAFFWGFVPTLVAWLV